jgi:spoIIIJ-associated protein
MPHSESEERKNVDVNAKTVDAAIEKGLDILGVSRDEVEIEVIKEASRGILGIGASDAVVRLTVVRSEPPTDQVPSPEEQDETTQIIELGTEVLSELLRLMEIEAEVSIGEAAAQFDDEQPVVLNITGRDLGLLIGRRGETLGDLQYLTRLIVGRKLAKRVNLTVDVEGYKARRERALIDLARRMANQVKETQRSAVLEPMPPNERRIVHLTLRDYAGVTTQSVGEGNRRKVMIIPEA